MKTSLAWFNLVHQKARTVAALAGVTMAILLIFLQFGIYRAAVRSSVLVLDQLSNDIVLVGHEYTFLGDPGSLDRNRIHQALAIPGVARDAPLYYGLGRWRNVDSGRRRELGVLGVDPASRPYESDATNALLPALTELDTAVIDRKKGLGFESFEVGTVTEVNGHRIEVVDAYTFGVGFVSNAGILVSDLTFTRIFDDASVDHATLGLLWLDPGSDPLTVKAHLRSALPHDVRIMTRAEHLASDQHHLMDRRPVGIMFTTGLWLAFIVGAVILYQILSSEVLNHSSEYATLKAVGYSRVRLYAIVWQQAVLYGLGGYVPAAAAAYGVYHVIDSITTFPTEMTAGTVGTVFAASAGMCSIAGLLAARKVDRADPADLF